MLVSLSKFKDNPESFPYWKNSFKAVVIDLNVAPTEEIDMLI